MKDTAVAQDSIEDEARQTGKVALQPEPAPPVAEPRFAGSGRKAGL
jgi:hypothetical protein